ncbi:MAG: Gfo/Idh/MocA family protein [Anaerolineae bacterium]
MRKLNVALIGYKFMGKAHSNAWQSAPRFFDLPAEPVLKVVCGRHSGPLQAFARRWGWQEAETDWRRAVERPDIDVVDIALPTYLHHDVAIAAAEAGKHIFCEKPVALSSGQAREMYEAAERHGVVHYLNHNYRRNPAVVLARQLIDEGRIGRIFHWRAAYLQSWIVDPEFPLTWHLRQELAGMGPHIDLGSHSVDLAHYLVGDIRSVSAMTAQFVSERPMPDEEAAGTFKGVARAGEKGRVTVEDAAFVLAEFAGGALGSFETSRFATGRKNFNSFEIYGDRGSLLFNQERMNELQFFSREDGTHAQGFRTILATEPEHAYVANWWPPGHIIGYEHSFVHAMADFVGAVVRGEPIAPNLRDGVRIMEVLEAGMRSAQTGQRVLVGG